MKFRPVAILLCGLCWHTGAAAQSAPVTPIAIDELQLRAGDRLDSVLTALKSRGLRIAYSSALVTPTMTLRTTPRATRVEALLDEILAPWQLRAVAAKNGDWLIVAAPPLTTTQEPVVEPTELPLATIDVTASRFGLATPGSSAVFLDRRTVEQMPHLGDDAVRMLKVLPGVTGGDFSAALNVRGGRREETLLRIDGAEIHGGYHFRDLDGALSLLDTNLVESIDFITGGMTADTGDYMSGVVDLRTRRPSPDDEYRSAAGISFVSAYGRTGGNFSEGRGAWLASVRRGYLDVVMEQVQDEDEQITPRYTDLFTSIYYDFGDRTRLSAHLLLGEDDLKLVSESDDVIDSAGDGRAGHFWINLHQDFAAIESATVLAVSEVRQQRDANGEDEQRAGDVFSDFRFRFLDLRSDWNWSLSSRQLLAFGFNANQARAEYDYSLAGYLVNPSVPGGRVDISHAHRLAPRGEKYGAHAAWRGRIGALVVEAGGRWDRYTYPGSGFDVTSPRFNAVWALGQRGELRGAWGVAHQPQGLHELQVEDDVTRFFEPERVQQSVLGYTHRFERGLSARLDVYRKAYSQLRPRFENALDPMQLIPEGAVDRVHIDAPEAEASGIEFTVRREAEQGFAGWLAFGIAEAEEKISGAHWSPRLWDQRRNASLGISWTGARWNLNLAGLYHSGAPTTALAQRVIATPAGPEDVIVAGPRNGARLGDYLRFDLRASRAVPLRSGRFSYYLEVTNLLDRKNPCCVESYRLEANSTGWLRLQREETYWLPMLPSFGFQYEF